MTRILIVDDHELVRRGLRQTLADDLPEVVTIEAGNAAQTLQMVAKEPVDMVLLDINLPDRNGLDVLQDLKALHPRLPVVVLTAFPEKDFAVRAFKLGASGYVCKHSAADELVAAIRKGLGGDRYITPSLAEALASKLAGEAPAVPHDSLSARELQVLREVALGKTLKQIAAGLSLSEKTVGTYRLRISRKLGLGTNVELARYATLHKLVD
jgi:DNA-binding NarL/FixJ family response regulator